MLEFKVHETDEEKTLSDTAQAALKQIEDKNYNSELTAREIGVERIKHYGFAFEGKKVLKQWDKILYDNLDNIVKNTTSAESRIRRL